MSYFMDRRVFSWGSVGMGMKRCRNLKARVMKVAGTSLTLSYHWRDIHHNEVDELWHIVSIALPFGSYGRQAAR
jgi:hypothetical protein